MYIITVYIQLVLSVNDAGSYNIIRHDQRPSSRFIHSRNLLSVDKLQGELRLSCKSQIPLRYPGRRQVRSWSQTGPKLVADLQRAGIWPMI